LIANAYSGKNKSTEEIIHYEPMTCPSCGQPGLAGGRGLAIHWGNDA